MLHIGDGLQSLLRRLSLHVNPGLHIIWHMMHLALSLWFFLLRIVESIESFLIAGDFLKNYEALDINRVQYLAVVIDSEEARDTSKVIELLHWLVGIGVKKVCLYDSEGVLKKYKEVIAYTFNHKEENSASNSLYTQKHLDMEVLSSSDGKEAVVKAANFLFAKHYATPQKERPQLTEPQMAEALAAIGSGGPDPDLLLIYGPTRCHLGFPAWRLRYTEIVHMGPLKYMKFGALVKAIFRFTMVHQNYGS